MTTHDETHITRTSPQRFAKGLVIIVVTLAILGYVTVAYWDDTASIPPPVSAPPTPTAPPNVPPTAGPAPSSAPAETVSESAPATTAPATSDQTGSPAISIPMGAATPGNPSYEPASLTVTKGDVITVTNDDSAPHTVTSGTGPQDPQSGQAFDTSIIMVDQTAEIDTSTIEVGEYPYYCTVHPFMTGTLTVQ